LTRSLTLRDWRHAVIASMWARITLATRCRVDRSISALSEAMEKAGLPFAPIRKPEDLFEDEHLLG
jgi:hypothetical protein